MAIAFHPWGDLRREAHGRVDTFNINKYDTVSDSPRILSAGPDRLTTAPLFTPAAFECVAEGNPPPIFKWFQKYVSICLTNQVSSPWHQTRESSHQRRALEHLPPISPFYNIHFRINSGAAYLERGREARLVIDNVTYDYQGEYECRATNYINGQERTVPSEPVQLQVVGE